MLIKLVFSKGVENVMPFMRRYLKDNPAVKIANSVKMAAEYTNCSTVNSNYFVDASYE